MELLEDPKRGGGGFVVLPYRREEKGGKNSRRGIGDDLKMREPGKKKAPTEVSGKKTNARKE